MQELVLAKEELFQGALVDVWKDSKNCFFMSREQIGRALEYKNPQGAIKDIHARNQKRLDQFSVKRKLRSTDGKLYETTLYSKRGIYEICRKSNQPKADAFFDWVYGILDALERGEIIWKERRAVSKDKRKDLNAVISEHYPVNKVKLRCIHFSNLLCELVTGIKSVGSYKKSIGIDDQRSLPQLLDGDHLTRYNKYLQCIAIFLDSGFTFKEISAILKGDEINITIQQKEKTK